jgi:hypothetical protein
MGVPTRAPQSPIHLHEPDHLRTPTLTNTSDVMQAVTMNQSGVTTTLKRRRRRMSLTRKMKNPG